MTRRRCRCRRLRWRFGNTDRVKLLASGDDDDGDSSSSSRDYTFLIGTRSPRPTKYSREVRNIYSADYAAARDNGRAASDGRRDVICARYAKATFAEVMARRRSHVARGTASTSGPGAVSPATLCFTVVLSIGRCRPIAKLTAIRLRSEERPMEPIGGSTAVPRLYASD